jgi:hypothetical protein
MHKILALLALLLTTTPVTAHANTHSDLVQKINQAYHTSFPVSGN